MLSEPADNRRTWLSEFQGRGVIHVSGLGIVAGWVIVLVFGWRSWRLRVNTRACRGSRTTV